MWKIMASLATNKLAGVTLEVTSSERVTKNFSAKNQ